VPAGSRNYPHQLVVVALTSGSAEGTRRKQFARDQAPQPTAATAGSITGKIGS